MSCLPGSRNKKNGLLSDARAVSVFIAIILLANLLLAGIVLLAYNLSLISYNSYYYLSDVALSLSFPASAFLYLIFYRKMPLRKIFDSLGMGRSGLTARNAFLGVLIFLAIFVLEQIVSLISVITSTAIQTNVGTILMAAPMWYYLFTAIVVPFDEETLFRGFMVPRLGIIASAAIFGILHYAYNSTFGIEIIAAFIFGVLAGCVFKRTRSIYPCIIAHFLVNAFAILSLVIW